MRKKREVHSENRSKKKGRLFFADAILPLHSSCKGTICFFCRYTFDLNLHVILLGPFGTRQDLEFQEWGKRRKRIALFQYLLVVLCIIFVFRIIFALVSVPISSLCLQSTLFADHCLFAILVCYKIENIGSFKEVHTLCLNQNSQEKHNFKRRTFRVFVIKFIEATTNNGNFIFQNNSIYSTCVYLT